MTIKPLVSLLRIALSTEKVLSLYQEINEHVNFHLISLLVFLLQNYFATSEVSYGKIEMCTLLLLFFFLLLFTIFIYVLMAYFPISYCEF